MIAGENNRVIVYGHSTGIAGETEVLYRSCNLWVLRGNSGGDCSLCHSCSLWTLRRNSGVIAASVIVLVYGHCAGIVG